MPEDKGLGSKLLGLFVETDARDDGPAEPKAGPGTGQPTAAQVVAELAAQATPRPGPGPAATARTGPAPAPATVNFDEVFRASGMDAGELDRVKKAEELLRSLPEATPREVKRQIVEASLQAFGVDVQKISAAATSQLKAVDTWLTLNDRQTQKAVADAQARIAQLEDQVITLRADIATRTEHLAALGSAGQLRKAQVQRVLEFFQAPAPVPPKPQGSSTP
jgi:hypothetical protein